MYDIILCLFVQFKNIPTQKLTRIILILKKINFSSHFVISLIITTYITPLNIYNIV